MRKIAILPILEQAVTHHREGRIAEAEALYRSVLEADPGNAAANHLLGVISYQAGNFPAAIDLLDRDIIVCDWYYYTFEKTPRVEAFNFAPVDHLPWTGYDCYLIDDYGDIFDGIDPDCLVAGARQGWGCSI